MALVFCQHLFSSKIKSTLHVALSCCVPLVSSSLWLSSFVTLTLWKVAVTYFVESLGLDLFDAFSWSGGDSGFWENCSEGKGSSYCVTAGVHDSTRTWDWWCELQPLFRPLGFSTFCFLLEVSHAGLLLLGHCPSTSLCEGRHIKEFLVMY